MLQNYVRMQVKRSPLMNLNNNKQSNLIQPLIGISKASTPLRTRIVGANSTPINQNKITNFHKSPNNKENHQTNHIKLQGCFKAYGIPQTQNRINLSPILAINKKMKECAGNQPKKSLTPEGYKAAQQNQNMGMINSGSSINEKKYQTLNDSKAYSGFNNTTNFSNLRTSNSFKNLIQARAKTPTRTIQNNQSHGISLLQSKTENGHLLKESGTTQMFRQFSKDCRPKLAESRSFDRFRPSLYLASSDSAEIKCMNNDGKKAKYRVINDDNDQSSDVQLYYCSMCTVPLVQQGFKVEEISKDTQKNDYYDENSRWTNDYYCKLEGKKSSIEFVLKDINQRESEALNQLNRYYNRISEFLESQRNQDKRMVQEYFRYRKNQPLKYLQETVNAIEGLTGCSANNPGRNFSQIQRILSLNQRQFIDNSSLELDSQSLSNNFIQNYNQNLKINFQIKNQTPQTHEAINSRNHALRFSFEKLLTDIHHKKSNIQSIMNPLQEEDQQYIENETEMIKEGHTAFRDLFPEVQEAQQANNGIHSPTFKSF